VEEQPTMEDDGSAGVPSPDEVRAGVRATFDRVADTYDATGIEFMGPIARGLLAELAVQPGERVLDVGCGRGAARLPLAAAAGPTGRVTGIDLSPRMVELTRADVAAAGLAETVEVRVGDAQEPDVPAGSVDVVSSSLVLFFLPDPAAALVAWHEVLVDGGRLGISTFGPLNEEWDVDQVFRPYVPENLPDPRYRVGGPFASDDAMEELVAAAGFRDVRTATTTVAVRFTDVDQWHRWSLSAGQRRIWDTIPADELDAVLADAAARLDACRRPDGAMGFDQGVRYTLGIR
jgi:ubiquinone/menaquinone biosynthesis C-methylase UbiE